MSWQAILLKTIFRALGYFAPSGDKLDIPRERAVLEGYTKVFKPFGKMDVTRLDAGGVPGAWIVPSGLEPKRTILYLHGGGYNAGFITSHLPLTCNIALAAKARVMAIDYRLAPEHLFPAAVDDALAAYQWLLKESVQPSQIVVAGDSAGGGLTLSLLLLPARKGTAPAGCGGLPFPVDRPDLFGGILDDQRQSGFHAQEGIHLQRC